MKISEGGILLAQNGTNERASQENFLGKQLARHLDKHYGHIRWRVEVDSWGGMVKLTSPDLSGRFGMYIPLKQVQDDPDGKVIIRYGGELLERYGVLRDQALAIKNGDVKLQRDFRGEALCDKG